MNFAHFAKATPEDLEAVDRLLNPQGPPERIYGWLNSQLSIARHYGGMTYQGHDYQIAYSEEGQPLVRVDVLKREVKEQAQQKKLERAALKIELEKVNGVLL